MLKTLLLVDAFSCIYRAYYAIRSLTGPAGEPVNAIYGFTKTLRKLLADHQPTHCAVVFDLGPPQQRLNILPSYKAQRPPTPDDLEAQLPNIRHMLEAMRLPILEINGEEADDIIAALAKQASLAKANVLIASNDKDFMQIVGPRVQILRPEGKQKVLVDQAAVEARYGVTPDRIVDLLSLIGDTVDNIPGVPGVGQKTAMTLLRKYHTLDNLLARAPDIVNAKLREAIISRGDQLRTNRTLITLRTDLKLPVGLEGLQIQSCDYPKLIRLCRQLGFKSLLTELEKETQYSDDLFGNN